MNSLVQNLFIIGAIQGILLFVLLTFDSRSSTANRLLGVLCLLLALSFLAPFITINRELNSFSFLIGWAFFFPASYGALNYLYYRHAVTEQPLSWKDLIHLTPVAICYILNLDWLLTSPETRLNSFQTGQSPMPTSVIISLYIFYVQAFVYNAFSAKLVYKYQKTAQNTLSNFNPDIFRWLWTFLTLTFVIWSLKVVADVTNIYSRWGDFLIVVFIYSVAIAQWRNPKVFQVAKLKVGKEQLPNAFLDKQPIDEIEKSSGALDQSTRESLLGVTKEYMAGKKPFLDNQLTLSSLSEAIGLSNHHLSEVLNQQEGKNFYQFINQYRIDYIIEQLQTNKSSTILDLALSAGFSSKSTFNAVFKQFTGQTPSQYRKSL